MTTNVHDEINLRRLLRRLEKSTSNSGWPRSSDDAWIKVQGTLQKVKYARKLLGNIKLEDLDPTPKHLQRYDDWRTKLNRIDEFMQELEMNGPKTNETTSYSSPDHRPLTAPVDRALLVSDTGAVAGEDFGEGPTVLSADNLLLSVPDRERPSSSSSVSPSTALSPTTTSTTTAVEPRSLQNSNAHQTHMAEQMHLMASQLKRNAVHFAELLANDQQVVEETESKLEGTSSSMHKVRARTKALNANSWSSTWIRMLIGLIVTSLFVFMFS
ncbi:hypothetical protein C8R47DRAFT_1314353 [Mycena vitilis]|nr:hypothetical protein C8R47DRAFT_1314353 [Mycena vitilis]